MYGTKFKAPDRKPQPQAAGIQHAQAKHDPELAVDETAQHAVRLAAEPDHGGLKRARNGLMQFAQDQVPVAQEVEGDQRHQQHIGHEGQDRAGRTGNGADQGRRGIADVLFIGFDPGFEMFTIGKIRGIDGQMQCQPGQRRFADPDQKPRHTVDQ